MDSVQVEVTPVKTWLLMDSASVVITPVAVTQPSGDWLLMDEATVTVLPLGTSPPDGPDGPVEPPEGVSILPWLFIGGGAIAVVLGLTKGEYKKNA